MEKKSCCMLGFTKPSRTVAERRRFGSLAGSFATVGYGLITGDWGARALVSGLAVATLAEVSYLTLGGGLAVAGTLGAQAGAGASFAAPFAVSYGTSLYTNSNQIRSASANESWNGVGLTIGYGAVAALGTGLANNTAISNSLGKGVNASRIWSNGSSAGLNTLLEKGYDVDSQSWNLSGQDLAYAGAEFGTAFASSYISEKSIGYFDKNVSNTFKGTRKYNYSKGFIKAYSQDISADLISLAWNKNNSWSNSANRDVLFSNLRSTTILKGVGFGVMYDYGQSSDVFGLLKLLKIKK